MVKMRSILKKSQETKKKRVTFSLDEYTISALASIMEKNGYGSLSHTIKEVILKNINEEG